MSSRLEDRYELGEPLAGGMADVYHATDKSTGEPCIVKTMSFATAKDLKSIELFERESKTLQSLDHPTIPAYIDGFVEDRENDVRFVLVQQVIEGQSLQKAIESGRTFDEKEIAALARSLVGTLRYLHGRKPPVIHRDIKPANIILGDDGQVYLIDFVAVGGLAKGSEGSTVVGTFGYMAPEQFQGQAFPETDYYSLGATLLHAASGRDPSDFPHKQLAIDFSGQIQASSQLNGLLTGLLNPFREKRAAFLTRLDNALLAAETGRSPVTKKKKDQPLVPIEYPHIIAKPKLSQRIKRWGGGLSAALMAFAVTIGLTGYPWNGSIPRPGEMRTWLLLSAVMAFVSLGLGLRGRPKRRWLWAWFVSMHVLWGSLITMLLAGFPTGHALTPWDFMGALGLTAAGTLPWFISFKKEGVSVDESTQSGEAERTDTPPSENEEELAELDKANYAPEERDLLAEDPVWQELAEQVEEDA